jgi:hypothetical protein
MPFVPLTGRISKSRRMASYLKRAIENDTIKEDGKTEDVTARSTASRVDDKLDSAQILALIDSDYISLRQGTSGGGGVDSAATLTLTNFEAGVFRINSQNLSTNHTIDSADNGMVAGPLTIDSGVTLIISGNLTVV